MRASCVVEEAAGFDLEAADVFVLGADAEEHGVFADAVADGDAVVELEHGGAVADAGDLLVDGLHVFEGHVVGGADVVGAHDDAAGVLHLDFVGAEGGDGVEAYCLPVRPTVATSTMEAEPMTMPSMVRRKRVLLARKLSKARLTVSRKATVERALRRVCSKVSRTDA